METLNLAPDLKLDISDGIAIISDRTTEVHETAYYYDENGGRHASDLVDEQIRRAKKMRDDLEGKLRKAGSESVIGITIVDHDQLKRVRSFKENTDLQKEEDELRIIELLYGPLPF